MWLWLDVEPQEFDRDEFSAEAIVRLNVEVGPDIRVHRVYEPVTAVTFVDGDPVVVFPDGSEIESPSWIVWGIVAEVER